MPESLSGLSLKTRTLVMLVTLPLALMAINVEIAGKERIVRNGTPMLLRLAPRDPRSLLHGDYMALQYAIAADIARDAEQSGVDDGVAVIRLGELNEASFVALYDGQQLLHGQYILRYRKRGDSVRVASDAYFFEEGSGDEFSNARFGELRVDATGEAVLTGLLDGKGVRLGPPMHAKR